MGVKNRMWLSTDTSLKDGERQHGQRVLAPIAQAVAQQQLWGAGRIHLDEERKHLTTCGETIVRNQHATSYNTVQRYNCRYLRRSTAHGDRLHKP